MTWKMKWTLVVYKGIAYLGVAGDEGMEKKMETTVYSKV